MTECKCNQVLVLLPLQGHSLSARFSGPYRVAKKLSDVDYVIHTPDHRRRSSMCRINMLKAYHSRDLTQDAEAELSVGFAVSSVPVVLSKWCVQVLGKGWWKRVRMSMACGGFLIWRC